MLLTVRTKLFHQNGSCTIVGPPLLLSQSGRLEYGNQKIKNLSKYQQEKKNCKLLNYTICVQKCEAIFTFYALLSKKFRSHTNINTTYKIHNASSQPRLQQNTITSFDLMIPIFPQEGNRIYFPFLAYYTRFDGIYLS